MQLIPDTNLKPYHTFSIEQYCHALVEVSSVKDIVDAYNRSEWQALPKLMLGKGSNLLFTEKFEGVVLINRLKGISHNEDDQFHYLHIEGGEDWPSLVKWCVNQGIGGVENLAMIPGCAGSAPIQNIGAYGLEFQDVCEYVDVLYLDSMETKRLSSLECQFGYRDSIFKRELFEKVVIVSIGMKLNKQWKPITHYGPLKALDSATVTPEHVFDAVCDIRSNKLPDPRVQGNAGSFFKNPVIAKDQFDQLQQQFPDIVGYPSGDEIKVAAGWLIDRCDLKGFSVGGAQVHPMQALVLINTGEATAEDVVCLAQHVRQQIWSKYAIALEHEVRFMGQNQETDLDTIKGRVDA
ncbi:UDP-N-acetylmuramate dehydrogenase [Vibrio maerlii]|uniref:UDP-N-acetylmuramate dehydrogenase n=1 Tax=Vibrio maerlii TaxID=2231648 RepID=UPI000E3E3C49|nr:UDP-N-acetylmuramate dehydrogenase [Vibrio maerlii]